MNIKELYPAILSAAHSISPIMDPEVETTSTNAGIELREAWLLVSAPTFEPEPISAAILNIRAPYTSPTRYHKMLQGLAAKGMLNPKGEGKFFLTEVGAKTIRAVLKSAYNAIGGILPLSVIDLMDLASTLKEMTDLCMRAPEPPGKWCIEHTRKLDPGQTNPTMVRIDQFISELVAYRDDAHLAAWNAYGISGHAWNILTLLWSDGTLSIETIQEKLEPRGFSVDETKEALDQLSKKGWVLSSGMEVKISPFGAEIRRIAEETTDRYYYAPFKAIPEKEIDKTIELLEKFRRGIPQ